MARVTTPFRSCSSSWRSCGRLLRLHAGGDCLRPDDDGARAGPVLRRHVAVEVRAQHDDDVVHRGRHRRHPVRRRRLVDGLRRRRHLLRQPVRAVLARRRHHRQLHLRDVPDDLRDHHRRADQRRGRRPAEVLRLGGLRPAVGRSSSTSRWPTWSSAAPTTRSSAAASAPRTTPAARRSTSTPASRPCARAAARQAHRLAARADAPAQPDADHARRRPAVVRLVRLQRRLDRLRPARRGPDAFLRSSTPRPAAPSPTPRSPRWPPSSAGCSIERLLHGKATSLGAASGIVAGLVAITPAAGPSTSAVPWPSASSPVASAPGPSA